MSVNATYLVQVTVKETLEVGIAAASNPIITHSGFNENETLNATSTPPATKVAAINPPLVAGAYTIDLTALTGTNGATVVGTGLKVQILRLINPAGNGAMLFKFGAANPYNLGNNASWQFSLPGGDETSFFFRDSNPDIASGAKNIDVSGTGTQSFKAIIVMG